MSSQPIIKTFEKNGITFPGLPAVPGGMERYPVPGGGMRILDIKKKDRVSIIDIDGQQPVEVVFIGHKRNCDPSQIDFSSTTFPNTDMGNIKSTKGEVEGILNIFSNQKNSNNDHSVYQVRNKLKKKGIHISDLRGIRLFGENSQPGNEVTFQSTSDGWLIVASIPPFLYSPNQIILPWEQWVASDVVVYVKRDKPLEFDDTLKPPDPLTDPLTDLNIQPGNASVYEVKAGEHIQILDVKGRECSDFQAFSLKALDRGLEREIDPTTTRSLMGALYPLPGIYSKYFTYDQEPLVEIVQDTCGRHDTFGLACTARYYEDLGYPGHINCSENINLETSRYGIKPRGGWPAINFFFNTNLDATNAIIMDDPWSRPGDYVLLRALSDLLCVSTACPCDIDPANGWNPTDIQVRVYGKNKNFKRSLGWRKSTEAKMEETKPTPFHTCFERFTGDFSEYNGYWLANKMTQTGKLAEYWACREKAAVMDLSPLRKYEVTGPDSEELMQLCVTRNMKKLSVGQVIYTAMCYPHGGMIDDGTVFRLGDDNFRWVGGNDTSGLWLKEKAVEKNLNVWVKPSTDQLGNIAVQGPLSRSILKEVFWTPPTQPTIEDLNWFRFTIARLEDFHGRACVVSRTGYSGELGYEVFCHPKDAEAVFDAIWKVGEPMGLTPLGLEALDLLRVESGLIFAGYEFSDQTDPFEAGIGFTVPLKSKEDDFIGKEALIERKSHPHRKLVGLNIEGGLVPSSGDCVRLGKAQVGEITSAHKSPILGKVIALARVDITHAEIGTQLEVGQLDGHQKRIKARVVPFPHFDPHKERAKGNY